MSMIDDDKENDYFDKEYEPAPPKPPKPPKYNRKDPRFWEKEESPWDHLYPVWHNGRLWIAIAVLLIISGIGIYMRYFKPYSKDCVQYGYIENIRSEGVVFKTYEGVLLPYREIMDTTRVYQRDFVFTAEDAKVGAEIKKLEMTHKPVKITYTRYNATVPWRGSSKIVVTAVEPIDPTNILPPEFRPQVTPKGLNEKCKDSYH